MLCYPKKLCPNDCNAAGVCDYWTGTCQCYVHRTGNDCSNKLCSRYTPLCEACDEKQCNLCAVGYYLTGDVSVCSSCYDFDPRCAGCTKDQGCTLCADPLLTSVRRSGFRSSDPSLPVEEATRELSITLPFGTKSPEAFAEAEYYDVVSQPPNFLKYNTTSCIQGTSNDDEWSCSLFPSSYKVCGHKGVFSFMYPNYTVREDFGLLQASVVRTGGGYGNVTIGYFLVHITTDDSDVAATARYTAAQQLSFEQGVVERIFSITIFDDQLVEENEVFQLVLEVPEGGGSLNAQFRANVTILDDDVHKFSADLSYMKQDISNGVAGGTFKADIQGVLASGQPSSTGGSYIFAYVENDHTWWEQHAQRHTQRKVLTVTDLGTGTYRASGVINEQGLHQITAKYAFPGGLKGDYYSDGFFQNLALSRIDRVVNFTWGQGRLIPRGSDFISIRWTGVVLAKWPKTYFCINADDHARLWIDGQLILDHWHETEVYPEPTRPVLTTPGRFYEV